MTFFFYTKRLSYANNILFSDVNLKLNGKKMPSLHLNGLVEKIVIEENRSRPTI